MKLEARLGGVGRVALAVLAIGCAGEAPSVDKGDGAVCSQCQVAGGETSDFGQLPEPTPCQESEVLEPITEAEARALGFGESLDLFTRSVTTPLAWEPVAFGDSGPPVTGYTASSEVLLTTRIASVEHLAYTLAGCGDDRLLVHVDASFRDTGGAFSIDGQLRSVVGREPVAEADGRLDLTTAKGSLRVSPPDSYPAAVGYFVLGVHYWPGATRGFTRIEVVEAGTEQDDIVRGYWPLQGRFPVDSCQPQDLPADPDEVLAVLGDRSAIAVRDELAELLETKQPAPATWSSGAPTSVTATLGDPREVCGAKAGISYAVPLDVTSADGRVQIAGSARAYAGVNHDGGLEQAWIEINDDVVLPVEQFPSKAGISGVDFAGLPQARWYANLHLVTSSQSDGGPRGEVIVEGVTIANGVDPAPVEELTWSLE